MSDISLYDFIRWLGGEIVEELFPSQCIACYREGSWLCWGCEQRAIPVVDELCPFCNGPGPRSRTCRSCQAKRALTGAKSVWYYERPIRELVHALKYRKTTAVIDWLVPYLIAITKQMARTTSREIIITDVPLAQPKQAVRGFNQSRLLAEAIARGLGLDYVPLLERVRAGPSQTKLDRAERQLNAKNQFRPLPRMPCLDGSIILIIDDVLTTGATLNACAEPLKSAGAAEVWGLTIAKD